jgi:hypothetical protein
MLFVYGKKVRQGDSTETRDLTEHEITSWVKNGYFVWFLALDTGRKLYKKRYSK